MGASTHAPRFRARSAEHRARRLPSDSGSQKVQHVFDGFKYNCESSSLTIDDPPENSSDLELPPDRLTISFQVDHQ
eukprot:7090958-Prymnesium_polylepis.1